MRPGCVRGGSEEDARAVGPQPGNERGGACGREVIVEDPCGIVGGDAYGAGLGKGEDG